MTLSTSGTRKKMMKTIALILLAFVLPGISIAENNLLEHAAIFAKAFTDNNTDQIAEQSHPSIVKALGGQKKYSSMIKKSFSDSNMRFLEMKFSSPTDIKKYKNVYLAILPYSATLTVDNEKLNVTSYYYAFAGHNKTKWYFTDCSNMDIRLLKSMVPDFDGTIKKPKEC